MWKQSVVASVVREKSSELNVSPGERFYIAHLVFQGYRVRKWSIDGMRKKLACAASHGRAFEGWDGPDGRRRGAPMTLRVPRFF